MHSLRSAGLATGLLLLTGCPFFPFNDDDEGDGGPCSSDVLGCENNLDQFELDPSCTLEGELELVLGQGQTQFEPLGPDEVPNINYGFQGGQHIWAALQVHNPALDYPVLKIEMTVSTCSASDCTNPNSWTIDATREMAVDLTTMVITSEDWFEQVQLLVIVENYGSGSRGRVEMRVTDPCDRNGYAVAEGVPVG